MAPERIRLRWIAIAACTVLACASLFLDRRERGWPGSPVLPYADSTYQHWLYRTLDELSGPGDTLGIWGWAAHVWVYSGLTPATRESSTEFALLDWGTDSYYRQRYMAALASRPPPFFVEAVGPGQFLFTDRATQGIAAIPGLQSFIATRYVPLLDDASIGLHVRRDIAASCCDRHLGEGWRDADGALRVPGHFDNLSELNGDGWTITDAVESGGTARLSLSLVSPREFDRVILPFMVGPQGERAGFSMRVLDTRTGTDLGAGCDDALARAAPVAVSLCVLRFRPTTQVQLSFTDTQAAPDAWVALGRPVMLRAGTRR